MKITKQQTDMLIKFLGFSEQAGDNHWENPILLGNVLEKIWTDEYYPDNPAIQMMCLWRECGLTNSIRSIVEKSGWEVITRCGECDELECDCITQKYTELERLENPKANALLSFLWETFEEKMTEKPESCPSCGGMMSEERFPSTPMYRRCSRCAMMWDLSHPWQIKA